MDSIDKPIPNLIDNLPQVGKLEAIILRPERKQPPVLANQTKVTVEGGLEGDHFVSTRNKTRQVTLIQSEHLEGVASMLGKDSIDPLLTRRNLVVSGINLLALRDKQFQIGQVVFQGTGYCHPCSRMEENLGPGGYNAMRGHGGITASVVKGGEIKLEDSVKLST